MPKSQPLSRVSKITALKNMTALLTNATVTTLSKGGAALWTSFFLGKGIHPNIPHLSASNILGHIKFDAFLAEKLLALAQTSPNRVASCWLGPIPVYYIAGVDAFRSMVRESNSGVTTTESQVFLQRLTNGNKVQFGFPNFQRVDSERHLSQRSFLKEHYGTNATQWLPLLKNVTRSFLRKHVASQVGHSCVSLREFITKLVLHNSSHLLSLTNVTLDKFYQTPIYRQAMTRVAQYGISSNADPAFEEILYQLFCDVFEKNFCSLSVNPQKTLIGNIMKSLGITFPNEVKDFHALPQSIRYDIALTFMATAVGGMVHSTVSTFDWAIANLVTNQNKLIKFKQLVRKNADVDLSDARVFEPGGVFYPLTEFILENVWQYPAFEHKFFRNDKSYTVTMPDGSRVSMAKGSLTIVNFIACNHSQDKAKLFSTETSIQHFISNPNVASFGGCPVNKDNHHTRICPAANTSLHEQVVALAALLECDLDSYNISCAQARAFPLCMRVDEGVIRVKAQRTPIFSKENRLAINPASFNPKTPFFENNHQKKRLLYDSNQDEADCCIPGIAARL